MATRSAMPVVVPKEPSKLRSHSPAANRELAELIRQYPHVELATLVDSPPEGDEWLHEIKLDGYRLLGYLAHGEVALRTRNGNDWSAVFPAIREALSQLHARSAVLDMEAVVLDSTGKSSFQAMQRALGEGGDRRASRAFAFDLLCLDGQDVSRKPLTVRKEMLAGLLHRSPRSNALHYSDHVAGKGAAMMAKSCAMGLEGVVSKLSYAPYSAGRQRSWMKSKCSKRQEFVIIGYTTARKGSRALGALHLGYNQGGQLRYAGKVGTGFTMRSAQELRDRLTKLDTGTPPIRNLPSSVRRGAHWVKPSLLCEVAFTEWTDDGRIRHPSFQGLRADKNAEDVTMEKPAPIAKQGIVKPKSAAPVLAGVTISHPERIIFKDTGLTKGQLAEYYAAASEWILRDLRGHPISLLRCPTGTSGDCFFQRNPGMGLGPDVKPFRWRHKGKSYEYLYVDDQKGLIELVQMGAIEVHPWGARVEKIDYPDRLIFDLDPAPDVPFDAVKLAARDLRRRLEHQGLESFVKCSGGKGLHVTVPLAEKARWPEVKEFCRGIAEGMAREVPEAYVATMTKAKRTGKIFVDFFRNDYTATAIVDFGVRARPGAPVAMPLEWNDLPRLKAANQFSIQDALKRLSRRPPDPARYEHRQNLPAS